MFESWPCTQRVSQPHAAIEWHAKGVYHRRTHLHLGGTIIEGEPTVVLHRSSAEGWCCCSRWRQRSLNVTRAGESHSPTIRPRTANSRLAIRYGLRVQLWCLDDAHHTWPSRWPWFVRFYNREFAMQARSGVQVALRGGCGICMLHSNLLEAFAVHRARKSVQSPVSK